MPTYRVELYELHTASYLVEDVASPATAIEQAMRGFANLEDNSGEFIELADAYGAPLAPQIAVELRRRGFRIIKGRMPAIRSVEEVP